MEKSAEQAREHCWQQDLVLFLEDLFSMCLVSTDKLSKKMLELVSWYQTNSKEKTRLYF